MAAEKSDPERTYRFAPVVRPALSVFRKGASANDAGFRDPGFDFVSAVFAASPFFNRCCVNAGAHWQWVVARPVGPARSGIRSTFNQCTLSKRTDVYLEGVHLHATGHNYAAFSDTSSSASSTADQVAVAVRSRTRFQTRRREPQARA
ncbi:hypothetical protein SB861_52480 [Paraburkholderia sp. SIMBA_049]